MTTAAQQKRYDGMRAMNDAVMAKFEIPGSRYCLTDTPESRKEIAAMIRPLASLGRTDRWQTAIRVWADAVENPGNTLQWAFVQYSVYAGYAA